MSDAALRRMLERAVVEPPNDLERRVLRGGHRRPWRWTAVAAAVVLMASLLAWSLARRESHDVGLTTDNGAPLITVHPVGDGTTVATWLPDGFHETHRDAKRTTWTGPNGATITYGSQAPPRGEPCVRCKPEPFAPGYGAGLLQLADGESLTWCNGASCHLEAHGVSELDTLRVAVSIVDRRRLDPVHPTSDLVAVPRGIDQWIRFADQPFVEAGFRTRFTFESGTTHALEQVIGQISVSAPTAPKGSIVTLVVASEESYDGFEPVRADDKIVGWVDTRLAHLTGPIPVVSFQKEERLQGYLFPERGFVWVDELLDPHRVSPPTTAFDRAATLRIDAPGASSVSLADGVLWVARQPEPGKWILERRDSESGALLSSIPMPGVVQKVMAGRGFVAAYGGGDGAVPQGGVAIIDTSTNAVVEATGWGRGEVVSPYQAVAVGGTIWVADVVLGRLVRFERSADPIHGFDVPGAPTALAAMGDGTLWYRDANSGTIKHFDPKTGKVDASESWSTPMFAGDGDVVWASDGERLVELRPALLAQGQSVALGARLPVDATVVVADPTGLWVATRSGEVQRWSRQDFDDAHPMPTKRVKLAGVAPSVAPWGLTTDGEIAWVINGDALLRV
jgi:hypothetical protein